MHVTCMDLRALAINLHATCISLRAFACKLTLRARACKRVRANLFATFKLHTVQLSWSCMQPPGSSTVCFGRCAVSYLVYLNYFSFAIALPPSSICWAMVITKCTCWRCKSGSQFSDVNRFDVDALHLPPKVKRGGVHRRLLRHNGHCSWRQRGVALRKTSERTRNIWKAPRPCANSMIHPLYLAHRRRSVRGIAVVLE